MEPDCFAFPVFDNMFIEHFFLCFTATAVEERMATFEFIILIPVTLTSASTFNRDLNFSDYIFIDNRQWRPSVFYVDFTK